MHLWEGRVHCQFYECNQPLRKSIVRCWLQPLQLFLRICSMIERLLLRDGFHCLNEWIRILQGFRRDYDRVSLRIFVLEDSNVEQKTLLCSDLLLLVRFQILVFKFRVAPLRNALRMTLLDGKLTHEVLLDRFLQHPDQKRQEFLLFNDRRLNTVFYGEAFKPRQYLLFVGTPFRFRITLLRSEGVRLRVRSMLKRVLFQVFGKRNTVIHNFVDFFRHDYTSSIRATCPCLWGVKMHWMVRSRSRFGVRGGKWDEVGLVDLRLHEYLLLLIFSHFS